MRLSDLFTGDKSISDTGKTNQSMGTQSGVVRGDALKRQLHSLVPGQTIQGEVISKNGSEVRIRLSEDMVLQARIDQNMNLEVGKTMTFEVKSNGQTLTLGPLFTNMALDANVMKALEMASLPINQTTVSMTKQLMEAGMPIDRNTLQQVYREANQFPQAQIADIVNLHKLSMPVNEGNITQIASYRNFTHQLVTGLNNVLDTLQDVFSLLMEKGDTQGAAELYVHFLKMVQDSLISRDGGMLNASSGSIAGQPGAGDNAAANLAESLNGEGALSETDRTLIGSVIRDSASVLEHLAEGDLSSMEAAQKTDQIFGQTQSTETNVPNEENLSLIQNDGSVQVQTFPEGSRQGTRILAEALMKGVQTQEWVALTAQLKAMLGRVPEGAGSHRELLKNLLDFLQKQWLISPEEVADKDRVEDLYRQMGRQLKSLTKVLENIGQTDHSAFRAVTSLSQNLDFLQQINQTYTYLQLPLRLQQGEAHGDLYVYTSKKHLARKDGQISALLHLDMEHLGPVDVYVAMSGEKVNTRFLVRDDEMLDFLIGHMDILTTRLQKRGYQCSFEMQVREQGGKAEDSISRLMQEEHAVPLAEYSFDVRT